MSDPIQPIRVVVDTNVFVSAALSIDSGHLASTTARLFQMIAAREMIAVVSTQTYYELADKLGDPAFGLSAAFIRAFIETLTNAADVVAIRGLDMGCKGDPDDNMFVETAVNGRVDFLVTYDGEFARYDVAHELAKRGCEVLTAGELLKRFTMSTGT